MSSLSTSLLGLLDNLKYSLLQLWIRVQDRAIFSIGAITGLTVLYAARYFASPYRKIPPGPRGYPIIGNLLEMGSDENGSSSQNGKRNTVSSLPTLFFLISELEPVITRGPHLPQRSWPTDSVINSPEVGVALLDRRAAIYSDRPRNIVASDIMAGGLFFGFSRYDAT